MVEVNGRSRLVGLDAVDAAGNVIPGMRFVGAQAINPAMADHILPSEVARFRALSEDASVRDVPSDSRGVRGSIYQTNISAPLAVSAPGLPPVPPPARPRRGAMMPRTTVHGTSYPVPGPYVHNSDTWSERGSGRIIASSGRGRHSFDSVAQRATISIIVRIPDIMSGIRNNYK